MMELRRLAARAQRNEDYREVLVDALLETYPMQFNAAIEEADRKEAGLGRAPFRHFVWFFPNRMVTRGQVSPPLLGQRWPPSPWTRRHRMLFEALPVRKIADLNHLLMRRNRGGALPFRLIQDDTRSAVRVYEPP